MKRATRKRNRRQWLDGLNIISVISVNQHLASVLPFPYFGQTLLGQLPYLLSLFLYRVAVQR